MRSLLPWTIALALSAACAAPRPIVVGGGVVRNATGTVISRVEVLHHPTGTIARVSQILPDTEFALEFSAVPLRAVDADVSWHQGGRDFRVRVYLPDCPACRADGKPYQLVYRIGKGGEVRVGYELVP
jgi:hypothetical protein